MKRFVGLLKKDLKVAFRNYYLLIVLVTALIFAGVINFVIPEEINMDLKMIYLVQAETEKSPTLLPLQRFLQMSPGNLAVASREELVEKMQDDRSSIGMILKEEAGQPVVETVLQGHESEQTKQALKITLRSMLEAARGGGQANIATRILREPTSEEIPFNQLMVPIIILMEPVMLGFILIAALVFMEKEEETTKAFLVSPGRISGYLASKIVVMFLLGLLSTVLITSLTVGFDVNWGLLILLLFIGSIFGSALGLFIGSLFNTISKAMVWVIGLSLFLVAPQVSYFSPGFAPGYLTWLPTYSMSFALKEALFPTGNMEIVYSALLITGGMGLVLYLLAVKIYQRTLGRD